MDVTLDRQGSPRGIAIAAEPLQFSRAIVEKIEKCKVPSFGKVYKSLGPLRKVIWGPNIDWV
jgi:hypothetical protein